MPSENNFNISELNINVPLFLHSKQYKFGKK